MFDRCVRMIYHFEVYLSNVSGFEIKMILHSLDFIFRMKVVLLMHLTGICVVSMNQQPIASSQSSKHKVSHPIHNRDPCPTLNPKPLILHATPQWNPVPWA